MLCILTSDWVLRMPFAGQNHLFWHINKFFHIVLSLMEKRKKKERKTALKHAIKGGLPTFRCYIKWQMGIKGLQDYTTI